MSKDALVVSGNGVGRIGGVTPDELFRRKVSGQWLYSTSRESAEAAIAEIARATAAIVSDWFIAGMPWLAWPALQAVGGAISDRRAVELIQRDLVRQGRYGVLGITSARYLPYLAIFTRDVQPHVEGLLRFVANEVGRRAVSSTELAPPPGRIPANDAWRSHVLKHAEFLGLGSAKGSLLVRCRR